MSEPALPQDLLDEITASVAQVDRRSLGNLALTSKLHFLHQAQSHQFRELIMFGEVRGWGRRVLDNKPSLFKHVRSMRVWFEINPEPSRGCGKVHVSRLQGALRALDYVTGPVESLDLSFAQDRSGSVKTWEEMSKINPYLVELVERLFAYPVTKLTLPMYPSVELPARSLQLMPLRTVTFLHRHRATFGVGRRRAIGAVGGGQQGSGNAVVPAYLRMLMRNTDEGERGVVPLLIDPEVVVDFWLVDLALYVHDVDTHKIVWSLFGELGNCSKHTLQSIYLNYNLSHHSREEKWLEDVAATPRVLPHFPLLRKFHISVTVVKERPPSFDVLTVPPFLPPFLCTMLGTNTQPSLETLNIRLDWALHSDPREYLTTPLDKPQRRWGRLDAILADTALYPRLLSVGLGAKASLARGSMEGNVKVGEEYKVQYAVYERNVWDCKVGLRRTMGRKGVVRAVMG